MGPAPGGNELRPIALGEQTVQSEELLQIASLLGHGQYVSTLIAYLLEISSLVAQKQGRPVAEASANPLMIATQTDRGPLHPHLRNLVTYHRLRIHNQTNFFNPGLIINMI